MDIASLIPHREPFLWIDEVVESTPTSLHARKHLSADLDVFRGHYPHFPVLPGVLQCEAIFQAGAVLIALHHPMSGNAVPVVTRVNNVQFRRMVRPGETLDLYVELTETLANAFFLKGTATVAGTTTCRLEFACAAAELDADSSQ
jgi:3-hydroxyacyl-[acyl-carrier-protein] dehydratase